MDCKRIGGVNPWEYARIVKVLGSIIELQETILFSASPLHPTRHPPPSKFNGLTPPSWDPYDYHSHRTNLGDLKEYEWCICTQPFLSNSSYILHRVCIPSMASLSTPLVSAIQVPPPITSKSNIHTYVSISPPHLALVASTMDEYRRAAERTVEFYETQSLQPVSPLNSDWAFGPGWLHLLNSGRKEMSITESHCWGWEIRRRILDTLGWLILSSRQLIDHISFITSVADPLWPTTDLLGAFVDPCDETACSVGKQLVRLGIPVWMVSEFKERDWDIVSPDTTNIITPTHPIYLTFRENSPQYLVESSFGEWAQGMLHAGFARSNGRRRVLQADPILDHAADSSSAVAFLGPPKLKPSHVPSILMGVLSPSMVQYTQRKFWLQDYLAERPDANSETYIIYSGADIPPSSPRNLPLIYARNISQLAILRSQSLPNMCFAPISINSLDADLKGQLEVLKLPKNPCYRFPLFSRSTSTTFIHLKVRPPPQITPTELEKYAYGRYAPSVQRIEVRTSDPGNPWIILEYEIERATAVALVWDQESRGHSYFPHIQHEIQYLTPQDYPVNSQLWSEALRSEIHAQMLQREEERRQWLLSNPSAVAQPMNRLQMRDLLGPHQDGRHQLISLLQELKGSDAAFLEPSDTLPPITSHFHTHILSYPSQSLRFPLTLFRLSAVTFITILESELRSPFWNGPNASSEEDNRLLEFRNRLRQHFSATRPPKFSCPIPHVGLYRKLFIRLVKALLVEEGSCIDSQIRYYPDEAFGWDDRNYVVEISWCLPAMYCII